MNADTREWWVIQDGQIRFTIDGEEPFVASKGYLVQVPYRTMYTMETVGDRPSLRFEVNIAKARKMYPMDAKPAPVAGLRVRPVAGARVRVRMPRATSRSWISTPSPPAPTRRAGLFTTIAPLRTSSSAPAFRRRRSPDKGHFHPESAEFWFILLDKIRYNIEGLPVFVADRATSSMCRRCDSSRELRRRRAVLPGWR